MPGRKGRSGGGGRKPTHLHLVDGTHRTSRHGSKEDAKTQRERRIGGRVPTAPAWLGPVARREWKRLAPALHADGNLTAGDRVAFAAYCDAYEQLVEARAKIAKEGLTTINSAGGLTAHPAVAAANQARTQLRQLAVEFGLTPLSARPVKKSSKQHKTIREELG